MPLFYTFQIYKNIITNFITKQGEQIPEEQQSALAVPAHISGIA
jgi:hypothetical protein